MLASVSNSHSSYSSYNYQQHAVDTNKQANQSDKTDEDSIKLGVTGATQESSENQQDQQKIQQLKSRDLEVKTHEQAHLGAVGSLANGGASFTYSKGPNGVNYAVGGEVNIDTSPVNGDPAATLRKADTIRRAALAPASPSAQDQRVAAKATAMAERARADLVQVTEEEKELKVDKKMDQEDYKDRVRVTSSIEPTPESGSFLDIAV